MVNSSNGGREQSALATAVLVLVELDVAVLTKRHELNISTGGCLVGHDGGQQGESEGNDGQKPPHEYRLS